MPVSINNTQIVFNDGTTQSTAASNNPTVTAGTMYTSNWPTYSINRTATSYSLAADNCFTTRVTVNGVIRVRFSLQSPDTTAVTAFGRVFKNGVAFGTEQSTNQPTYQARTEDLTFAAGDLLQIAVRVSTAPNNANLAIPATGTSTGIDSNTGFNSLSI